MPASTEGRKPTLTVAVPSFNGADTINRTMHSVCEQLVDGVELLISDNCSTDETYDFAMKYAEAYPGQVTVYRNEKNVGALRNYDLAVRKSRGDFVWLFGDDDRLSAGCVKRVLDVLEANPSLGFVSVNADIYGAGWSVIEENTLGSAEDFPLSGVEDTYSRLGDHIGLTPTMIVRRDAWIAAAVEDGEMIDYWTHVRRLLSIAQRYPGYAISTPRVQMDQTSVRWTANGLFLTIIAEFCELVNTLNIAPHLKSQRLGVWYASLWSQVVTAKLNHWQFDFRTVRRLTKLFKGHPRFWFLDLPLLLTPAGIIRAAYALRKGLRGTTPRA